MRTKDLYNSHFTYFDQTFFHHVCKKGIKKIFLQNNFISWWKLFSSRHFGLFQLGLRANNALSYQHTYHAKVPKNDVFRLHYIFFSHSNTGAAQQRNLNVECTCQDKMTFDEIKIVFCNIACQENSFKKRTFFTKHVNAEISVPFLSQW